jgi:hypothetical protein
MRAIERVLERLEGVRANGDKYTALCPEHDDRKPSLSVSEGEDGKVLLHCFKGCATSNIVATLNLKMSDLFPEWSGNVHIPHRNGYDKLHEEPTAMWEIRDGEGTVQALHVRFDNNGEKKFLWRLPNTKTCGLQGRKLQSLPLYGSEKLKDWTDGEPIVVAEGEKATDALLGAGFQALGTVTGASGTPGHEALELLRGRNVVLWPDNDDPGRAHMERVASALEGIAAEVRIFEWGDALGKGDAADHPAIRSSDDEGLRGLRRKLLEEAPRWEAKLAGKPKIITASALLNMELPEVQWAVPGLVPEGVTLLAGKPKLGKSWLALGLCVAVASGGHALGKVPVERGAALYLGLEDNVRRLNRRLTMVLDGRGAPRGLEFATEWPRLDAGGAEHLEWWLKDHPDARLVVVDTLKKVRPRASGNRSVYDGDYEALEPLMPIAAEYGVSIVVVHHTRKAEADDPLDAVSGSYGLTGGVDGVMVLTQERGGADAYLHVDGRDVEEPKELALTWDRRIASWCIAGDAKEYRLNELRRAIIRILEEAGEPLGPKEVTELLRECGIDRAYEAVKQRMYQMSKSGQLKNQDGKYAPHNHNLHNPDNRRASGDSHQQAEVA